MEALFVFFLWFSIARGLHHWLSDDIGDFVWAVLALWLIPLVMYVLWLLPEKKRR